MVLIHWLGAVLRAWPQCEPSEGGYPKGRRGAVSQLCSQIRKNAEKMKKWSIFMGAAASSRYTQQTRNDSINTLPANMITEKGSNIFVCAFSITPLVKKNASIFMIQNIVIAYSILPF